MLKIVSAKVIVTCPGRNFVTLKIETSDGITGLGDATLNGRELAVASYLTDHLIPCLIGRDAHAIEDTWQYFYRGAYWRRGPVTMAAIAAVDMALWDIKAKAAGLPLYQLLGGKCRDGAMVYCHANGTTIEETLEKAQYYIAQGFKAVRLQSGVPGLKSTYGVSKTQKAYEPADADIPSENVWSSEKYLRSVPGLFKAARDALGWDVHLLHDIHHRLTPIEAARLGKDLEPYRPVLAGRRGAGGEPGQFPPDPPAHHHAAGGGRGLQQHLGLQAADRRTADRLYPRHRDPCRRHHPSAPHRRPGRSLQCAHRLPRPHRPVAGLHGGGAAFRRFDSQFRHPGMDASRRGDRRGFPPHAYSYRDGALHPGEGAGPGRGDR